MRDTAPNLRRVHLADIIEGFVGGIAQLGERLHGMQEVSGSIPLTSTTKSDVCRSRSSRGLGHDPFTVVTGVRIPYGTPLQVAFFSAKSV